jgi:hypothetical protein
LKQFSFAAFQANDVSDEATAPSPAISIPPTAASNKENVITKSVEKVKETTAV